MKAVMGPIGRLSPVVGQGRWGADYPPGGEAVKHKDRNQGTSGLC